jgi:hypothetical protein
MRRWISTFCFGIALFVTPSSFAATVQPVRGQVSLNRGQGFAPVNGPIEANVGDEVMVSPDGSAVVTYADGCRASVEPGAVTTIAPSSPCGSGLYDQVPEQSAFSQCVQTPACALIIAATGTALGVGIYEATRPASP